MVLVAPTAYRAVSMDVGFGLLLEKEEQKIMELEARAMRLIESQIGIEKWG